MKLMYGCVADFNFLPNPSVNSVYYEFKPVVVHSDTTYETIFEKSKLFGYLACQADMPVIIDTGA